MSALLMKKGGDTIGPRYGRRVISNHGIMEKLRCDGNSTDAYFFFSSWQHGTHAFNEESNGYLGSNSVMNIWPRFPS